MAGDSAIAAMIATDDDDWFPGLMEFEPHALVHQSIVAGRGSLAT